MSDVTKHIERLKFFSAYMTAEQEAVDDPGELDREDRELIRAVDSVVGELYESDDYVAWLRWNGKTYVTCDSDSPGAFRVYRRLTKGGAE